MSHFLTRLAQRTLGVMPTVKPLLAPLFATQRLNGANWQPLSSERQTSINALSSTQDALPTSHSRIQRSLESPLQQPEEEKIQKQAQPNAQEPEEEKIQKQAQTDSQEPEEEKIQKQAQPDSQEPEEEKIQKQVQQGSEEDKDTAENTISKSPQIHPKSTEQDPQMSSNPDKEEPTQVNMKSSGEGVIQRRMQASTQFQQPRTASVSRSVANTPVNPIAHRDSASRINPPQNPTQLPVRATPPQPTSAQQIERTPEQDFPNLSRDTLSRSEPKVASSVEPRSQSNSIEPNGESLLTSFYVRANPTAPAISVAVKPRLEFAPISAIPTPLLTHRPHSESRRPAPIQSEPTSESTVQIVIGRVIVRGVSSPPEALPQPTRQEPRLSLEEYLRQREGGGS